MSDSLDTDEPNDTSNPLLRTSHERREVENRAAALVEGVMVGDEDMAARRMRTFAIDAFSAYLESFRTDAVSRGIHLFPSPSGVCCRDARPTSSTAGTARAGRVDRASGSFREDDVWVIDMVGSCLYAIIGYGCIDHMIRDLFARNCSLNSKS